MNPAIALYALQFLQSLPMLIQTGGDLIARIRDENAKIDQMIADDREPTDAEWDALNAATAVLRAKLHAPDA